MLISIVLLISCLLCSQITGTIDDREDVPKISEHYRYFAEKFDQRYLAVGSCEQLKKTIPMSRCIVKINHQYKVKYFSISVVEHLIGTGTIILKQAENGVRTMIIITAFHMVVPRPDFTLFSFVLLSLLFGIVINIPWISYSRLFLRQSIGKMILICFIYVVLSSCLMYFVILLVYPFIFISSIEISMDKDEVTPLDNRHNPIQCDVITSRLVLSSAWFDDLEYKRILGLVRCIGVGENLFRHAEECQPKLTNVQFHSVTSSVNVIGYVGRVPKSFSLILDPHFSAYLPVIDLDFIDGETPSHLFNHQTIANCTGKLRLIDQQRLYIDTPATYGFAGGPCFYTDNVNPWQFDGILSGTTRLWNTCLLLSHSSIFKWHYNSLLSNSSERNSLTKEDI